MRTRIMALGPGAIERLPTMMRANVVVSPEIGIRCVHVPVPSPGAGQLLLRVTACGVCRTDLHLLDGGLSQPPEAHIPGHEVVGRVVQLGTGAAGFAVGDRVGVPWLGWTCGRCERCRGGKGNLCPDARFTGYQLDGDYAEYMVADARYCLRPPEAYSDVAGAPPLCAGPCRFPARAVGRPGRRRGPGPP